MRISSLSKSEDVGLLDVYLSGLNFARDVKAYVSKPEIKEKVLDVVEVVTQVVVLSLIVRYILDM